MRDFKYFLTILIPFFGLAGFYFRGWASPGSVYLGFVIIPLFELFLPPDHNNDSEDIKFNKSQNLIFDFLLYINLPVLYSLLIYFIYILNTNQLNVFIWFLLVLNMGVLLGVLGINVAHELGHRPQWYNQFISQLLLLPCLYMHFTIQHNYWHHKYVATTLDSSTAKINEPVYFFWWRSFRGGILNAIKIEKRRLQSTGYSFFHFTNNLFWQFAIQLFYLFAVYFFAGFIAMVSVIVAAMISILLLETINYIEHYGLLRKEYLAGIYELADHKHSWNSDHILGRIFLYELTRHPHHHEKTSIKYQSLESLKGSPQLPFGYPACLMMALIPTLWFKVIHGKLEKHSVSGELEYNNH